MALPANLYGLSADWSKQASIPGNERCLEHAGKRLCYRDGQRSNIYELSDSELSHMTKQGAKHALDYPVQVTRLLIPKVTMQRFFDAEADSPVRSFVYHLAKQVSIFKNFDDIYEWVGLAKYPQARVEYGPNPIPYINEEIQNSAMGVTIQERHGTPGLTFSCAACHSADLFGVKVLGMTNRFPRANEFFDLGKTIVKRVPVKAFKALFNPVAGDVEIFKNTKEALKDVEVKRPLALGLDTSLAQVALSLSRRAQDEYASPSPFRRMLPRHNQLRNTPADSKPAVWWNVKYKTRWLSDGSIVSGNPVHTNFLWNEIGRGVDLKKLETWLANNTDIVQELTSAVFASEAPRYDDFFPKEIDIAKAQAGEALFLNNCSSCHGQYEKGWSNPDLTDYKQKIATTKVWYHKQTPVIDVGTDPLRHQGMKYFSKDLNRLKISKSIGTIVEPQKGYVPPPLVGIWARWPYFHNNSVPTLYDVLTPDFKRPKSYVAVPATHQDLDFDKTKNGYPAAEKIRPPYRNDKKYFYDTTRKGMSNQGHTKMMLDSVGNERFSHKEKLEIIEFLKTL